VASLSLQYRAKDIRALLRLVVRDCGCAAWVFLHPWSDSPKFIDAAGEPYPLDALLDGQFEPVPHRGNGMSCGNPQSPWISRLIGLLSFQFPPVSGTSATMLVWAKSELLAVLGVIPMAMKAEAARTLVEDLAHAVLRIHEFEKSEQELRACRYVIRHSQKACLVVNTDRDILAATDSAVEALHAILGRGRPTRKAPIDRLPESFAPALKLGEMKLSGKIQVHVAPLAHEAETVSELQSVLLTPLSETRGMTINDRVCLLTPTQKAIYTKILAGMRNKEIAAEMGISKNTVLHHVSSIFAKLHVMDRLQLFARLATEKENQESRIPLPIITGSQEPARSRKPKILEVSPMVTAEVMPDLPVPVAKARREDS
jgi:DNA-binding NarL/FixJ family response regulator